MLARVGLALVARCDGVSDNEDIYICVLESTVAVVLEDTRGIEPSV